MRLYRAGDRSAGICETCRSKVSTRLEYRDYTPTGWKVTVPDVLVSVCERCGGVVGVPHQSMPRINEFRDEKPRVMKGIEARVPRVIEDALELVAASLGGSSKVIRPAVLRYYLGLVARSPAVAEAVKIRSGEGLARGKADRRLVVKLDADQWAEILGAAKAAGIGNPGQLLRGVAVLAAEDCQITYGEPERGAVVVKAEKGAKARHAFLKEMARAI